LYQDTSQLVYLSNKGNEPRHMNSKDCRSQGGKEFHGKIKQVPRHKMANVPVHKAASVPGHKMARIVGHKTAGVSGHKMAGMAGHKMARIPMNKTSTKSHDGTCNRAKDDKDRSMRR
jgi:hypothetical protein